MLHSVVWVDGALIETNLSLRNRARCGLWNSLWELRSSVQINDLPLSEWDCANQRGGMGEMLKAQVSSARRKGNLAVKEAQASQPGPPTEDAEREFACLASWDPRATQTEMCGTDHSNSHASAEKELHMTFLRGFSWSCLRRDAHTVKAETLSSKNPFLLRVIHLLRPSVNRSIVTLCLLWQNIQHSAEKCANIPATSEQR